jgi:hypothetical protein
MRLGPRSIEVSFATIADPNSVADDISFYKGSLTASPEAMVLFQKGKGPVDYLVIEHVEKPSAN